MRNLRCLLAVATLACLAALPTLAPCQNPNPPPANPNAVQIDTTQPGRVTLAYFSDSKTSLAGLTFGFKPLGHGVEWSLVYTKTVDGSADQFLGTAVMYVGHPSDKLSYAIGFGFKGLDLTQPMAGRFDVPRQPIFGAGFTYKYGA